MSGAPHPNVAVSIDVPLLSHSGTLFEISPRPRTTPTSTLIKSILGLLAIDRVKYTLLGLAAGLLVVGLWLKSKERLRTALGVSRGHLTRLSDKLLPTIASAAATSDGIPMEFSPDNNEGWGICSLAKKQRLGKSNFVKFEFDLPDSDLVLPLNLGQQITMSCLDSGDTAVMGSFYPYVADDKVKTGKFSILVPNYAQQHKVIDMVGGEETANFVTALKAAVKVGDEIAVKPGPCKLQYRGQALPVTDMVYIAYGTGIAPVLEQVRAVLPSGSSSVTSVSVVWINDETVDFDVNAELLEKEYFKYSTKLAASCIVDDIAQKSLTDSVEVNAAVPDFRPGTMAVLAGPSRLTRKTVDYLEDRGYPYDVICVL
jgi:NAD(P)H-flavin reductase